MHGELIAWASEQVASAVGALRGVDLNGVPAAWRQPLRWAGVPLSLTGALVWSRDLAEGADAALVEQEGRLLLPTPAAFTALSSVALKPLRIFLGTRLGVRLQASPGIFCYLWANQALLVSALDVPVGGFLYGPQPGTRASIALSPGGSQRVRW